MGTDLDICAVEAVAQNCEVNGIDPAQFDMMIGNIITDKEVQDKVGYECYDIVVANILADVLVPLTPVIVHQLKKGGIYITSGIIDDKEQTVVEAVKAAGKDNENFGVFACDGTNQALKGINDGTCMRGTMYFEPVGSVMAEYIQQMVDGKTVDEAVETPIHAVTKANIADYYKADK